MHRGECWRVLGLGELSPWNGDLVSALHIEKIEMEEVTHLTPSARSFIIALTSISSNPSGYLAKYRYKVPLGHNSVTIQTLFESSKEESDFRRLGCDSWTCNVTSRAILLRRVLVFRVSFGIYFQHRSTSIAARSRQRKRGSCPSVRKRSG